MTYKKKVKRQEEVSLFSRTLSVKGQELCLNISQDDENNANNVDINEHTDYIYTGRKRRTRNEMEKLIARINLTEE
jgi:hypothetical protein